VARLCKMLPVQYRPSASAPSHQLVCRMVDAPMPPDLSFLRRRLHSLPRILQLIFDCAVGDSTSGYRHRARASYWGAAAGAAVPAQCGGGAFRMRVSIPPLPSTSKENCGDEERHCRGADRQSTWGLATTGSKTGGADERGPRPTQSEFLKDTLPPSRQSRRPLFAWPI